MFSTLMRSLSPSLVLGLALTGVSWPQNQPANSELTAHEWGTFTSIVGRNGQAVTWLPLNGSTNLPRFVEHFRTAEYKVGLRGTIRMETPVIYFYSPGETTVSVKVAFAKGVITEWYPHASRIEPNPKDVLNDVALYQKRTEGSIAWDSVTVSPGLAASLPSEDGENHYFAARETSAAPLVVRTRGRTQQEKFLFYRGVSTFPVPISATVTPEGKLQVNNLGEEEIPSVIMFERHGDRLGYRSGGALQSEMLLTPPELTSSLESMNRDLAGVLIAQGLYPDEARAMLETWRGSWFEEGSRLFYIVPPQFVNTILPLTIHPVPSRTVRVFVGRLELITPATEQAVEQAIAGHDRQGIGKYGRFLEPILEEMRAANPAMARQLDRDLSLTYRSEAIPTKPEN